VDLEGEEHFMMGIFITFTVFLALWTEEVKNNEMEGAQKFAGALKRAKSSFYNVTSTDYYETYSYV
jgi:hypothetical protein